MKFRVLVLVVAITALCNTSEIVSVHNIGLNSHILQAANSNPDPGALYVSSNNITNLPAGNKFTLGIQVANASYFFGWDVSVQTDPNIIKPVSVNFTYPPDLFVANYSSPPTTVGDCINGVVISGGPNACGSKDGLGVAHLAAAILLPPPNTTIVPPVNGLLFNITYDVVATVGFSPIRILTNATLVTRINGNVQALYPSLIAGVYGKTVPYPSLTASPTSPSVPQGALGVANLTLTSNYGFAGSVNLTISVPRFSDKDVLGGSLTSNTLILKSGGSNSTKLILNATSITSSKQFPITITLSSTSPVNIPLPLQVNVKQLPFFQASINPGLIRIHSGQSGNTTVELLSQIGFQGTVSLALAVPPVPGLTASIANQTIALPVGGILYTTIYVSTPTTALPFLYQINLTASGMGSYGPLYVTQTVQVMPPRASLLVHLNPSTVVVTAGSSGSATINALSVDYFWGFSYVSAIMSGGTVTFDHTSDYIPLPNSASATVTPSGNFSISIAVPPNAIPGNYVVLLTVYSLPTAYQKAVTEQIAVAVTVHAGPSHASILGLAPPVYFGILGVLVLPLAFFSGQAFRKRRREEKDESWKQ